MKHDPLIHETNTQYETDILEDQANAEWHEMYAEELATCGNCRRTNNQHTQECLEEEYQYWVKKMNR